MDELGFFWLGFLFGVLWGLLLAHCMAKWQQVKIRQSEQLVLKQVERITHELSEQPRSSGVVVPFRRGHRYGYPVSLLRELRRPPKPGK